MGKRHPQEFAQLQSDGQWQDYYIQLQQQQQQQQQQHAAASEFPAFPSVPQNVYAPASQQQLAEAGGTYAAAAPAAAAGLRSAGSARTIESGRTHGYVSERTESGTSQAYTNDAAY